MSFLPTKVLYSVGNAAPRTNIGRLVGYRLQTGATWSGAYIVLDLDKFVNKSLRVDGQERWGHINHYVTKRVDPFRLYVCPLKKKCGFLNSSLEGREASREPDVLGLDLDNVVLGPDFYDQPALRDAERTTSDGSMGELVREATRPASTHGSSEDITASASGGTPHDVLPPIVQANTAEAPHGYTTDGRGRRHPVD